MLQKFVRAAGVTRFGALAADLQVNTYLLYESAVGTECIHTKIEMFINNFLFITVYIT